MFGLKLNPIIIKNEVLCAKEYYAFYRQSFPFFSEPPLLFPPPPHTHFWQHFFLSISPQRNTGEVQNKLMSESYLFIFKRLQNNITCYILFFKKKLSWATPDWDLIRNNRSSRSEVFYNFIWKEALAQVFSCEFCEISNSTFIYRTLLVAASEIIKISGIKMN